MATQYLDEFCGSTFWNITSVWYTNDPEFTECFEKTALVWIPCIFLWLFWVLDAVYMKYSYTRNVPWNWRNISKLVLTGTLILLTFIELIATVSGKVIVYNADIYSPLVKIISFILSIILVYYNRKYGMHSSGVLFIFWLLLTICGVPQFRREINNSQRDQVPEEVYTSHILYLIYYPIVVLMFILNIIADKPAEESKYPKSEKPCPEETASFISRVTFSWFDILIWRGFKNPLQAKDLWDMNPEDTTKELVPRFEENWYKTLEKVKNYNRRHHLDDHSKSKDDSTETQRIKKQASILPAIIKTFGPAYLFAISLRIVQDILMFLNPQILGLMISFVREGGEEWKGITYAFLLFANAMVQTSFQSTYLKKAFTMGMRVRSVVISVIYKKALTMSNMARRERTVGEIVNLMAVDAQKFMDLANHINQIWSAPLQISLAIFFLWQEMGPAVLSGLAIMIVLIPINAVIANKNKRLHVKQMKFKDERVKQMNEVLNGIKVLKLYAWEPSFENQILRVRDKEIQVLKHSAYLHAGTSFILTCAPFLVSLVTFATYVLIDENNILDANKAYVSISLFNIMRQPLNMLPNLISNLIQTVVSVKRLNKFMNSEDLDPSAVFHEPNKDYPLTIENGTFSWGDNTILKDINIRLKANTLTAVVGSVGSGKSSLVSAFLGEMEKISGRVNTFGSIAYVSQQAYIQNATLKDNILFGRPYDKELFDKVIHSCALKPDLDMLPGADLTEIGEKGINLSGGQKQRVSLARAVYANADIYFMDDPLSAVDSHVGKHIFEQVMGPKGLLKNKTRLLVTHGITYLPQTDHIIVIKDGEISENGTYSKLLSQKGAFAEFLLQHLNEDSADDNELDELQDQLADTSISEEVTRRLDRQRSRTSDTELRNGSIKRVSIDSIKDKNIEKNLKKLKTKAKRGQKLTEKEKAETGNVSLAVYKYYLKSIGYIFMLITVGFSLIYQGFQVSSNVWLGMWADDDKMVVNGTVDTGRRDMYLGVYGILGVGQVTTLIVANLVFTKATLDAAVRIHQFLLNNILRLPMAFFDTTPMGRILARFSNDINGVDQRLPNNMQMIIMRLIQVIGSLAVICYTVPWFALLLIPISIVYIFMQRLYVATSRQLKRLESVSRSPIYSHFGETVSGLQVIRAFSQQQRFILESDKKVDLNQVCHYPSIVGNRWISIRLEMMGNFIILFASMFCVLGRNMAPGIVGLTISYALQITQLLNFIVRQSSDMETNIVAVERIKEYGEATQEAAWEIPSKNPPKSWPEIGAVEFQDYAVRYRPGLDLVLTSVNFHINGGEKIGIVGRTGAGKSSMTLSLFRIIEAAQGQILIDDINVAEIGLHSLRSRLTIIPQDAVLFSGSLRMNLDPFHEHSDQEIWTTLEHAHLKPFVKGLPAGLQHEIAEGGENLSAGQRQLVCLARALLRKTKILILDEATAAVDLETDDLIQKTIRTEFKECTVITIAHRLNTIMDSDRIMVLDKGKIVEFDSPENLLANPDSIFSGMHKDAGLS